MAYYNGNVYTGKPEVTAVLHDECMDKHPERFVLKTMHNGEEIRFQLPPWCWSPVWSLKPGTPCDDCGLDVVGRA